MARFDVDQLYDYRARRPIMRFDVDHWSDYDTPQLAVHLLHDSDDTPYLMLAGPEPDNQWERYAAAVALLVERLGVRLVVGLDAFPMSVPHSRPTPIIVHGSRRELFADYRAWLGQIMVPASAGHLVEYRLGAAGVDALGIAAPVPPYLVPDRVPDGRAGAAARGRRAGRAALRHGQGSRTPNGVNRKRSSGRSPGPRSCRHWSPRSSSSTTRPPPRRRPRSPTVTCPLPTSWAPSSSASCADESRGD